MNYLKDKTCYLCGPIKLAKDDGVGWRNEITPLLLDLGVQVIDPCNKNNNGPSEIGSDKARYRQLIMKEKWKELKKNFWPCVRFDLRACDKSDFIIFYYDPDIPTIGTIHELVVSSFEKKPILLVYDKDKLDRFNPWMCVFIKENHFFSSWVDMFNYLQNVNEGKLDTSLWVI